MSETARQLAVDAVAELYVERQRIAAALAILDQTRDAAHSHYRGCWQHHAGCLAARASATLTGEEPTDAAAR